MMDKEAIAKMIEQTETVRTELVCLVPRLTQPYRTYVQDCVAACERIANELKKWEQQV